jgi:4-amino-4-deoxy-L-arabinose transferase-like glycosyltransferase
VATHVVLGLGFLMLSGAARLVFLNWGLPYLYQGDEPFAVAVIQRMIAETDLNPHAFYYPSFFYYVNLPGQYFVRWWDGTLASFTMQSYGNGFTTQPEAFLAGRTTTLLFGLAILPILMFWARTVSVGIIGLVVLAAMFCLNPLLLRNSTLITPDIFAAFFATATLLISSLIVRRGEHWTYFLAGVMAGMAASSKYNAGLVVVAIATAHVLRSGLALSKLRPLILSAVTTALVFLLSSPFIALDPRAAAHGILSVMRHYQTGHLGAEGRSLEANTGWMFDDFGFAGVLVIAIGFSPRVRALLPTALFIVAYFSLLAVQYTRFNHNLLPLAPAMLLLIAVGIDSIAHIAVGKVRPKASRPVVSAIFAILALALFARPAMSSLGEIVRYDRDPRATARVWLNQLLPRTPKQEIAVDSYAPYIDEEGRAVTGVDLILAWDRAALARFSYIVLSKGGSGRFLQGNYDRERDNFAALKARSCDYRQFPGESAEPDYLVLISVCD